MITYTSPTPARSFMGSRFALYGRITCGGIRLPQLLRLPDLLARTEDSGCEGAYVEVARWNRHSGRWERFAFQKFFGGEIWPDLGAVATADRVAAIINVAQRNGPARHRRWHRHAPRISVQAFHSSEQISLIHNLPTWNPRSTPALAGKCR